MGTLGLEKVFNILHKVPALLIGQLPIQLETKSVK